MLPPYFVLPCWCSELSVRGCPDLTDGGLAALADRRGGAPPGAGLAALDVSACTGLTDQFWLAIVEVRQSTKCGAAGPAQCAYQCFQRSG
jgi:hypothetical protein